MRKREILKLEAQPAAELALWELLEIVAFRIKETNGLEMPGCDESAHKVYRLIGDEFNMGNPI